MMRRFLLLVVATGIGAGPLACDDDGSAQTGTPLLVFGRTGMGPGEFSYPRAAVAAPDGRVYIVDKAARIQCYSRGGEFLFDWRMPLKDAGKPTGLGVDRDGNVYVADTHYARVLVFDSGGRLLSEFGTFGEGPGQFKLPTDVVVDHEGYVYVSEYGGNDRVSKFSPSGAYLLSFGGRDAGEARLKRPQSLLADSDGSIWVADSCNHRVCRFDADGRFLSAFGHPGREPGELRFPYGLDMLSDGTLIVTEYGNNRVQRFDREGRSLGTWGVAGRRPGELAYPWAAVVAKDDRVVIIDSGNNRVQVIDGLSRKTWQTP